MRSRRGAELLRIALLLLCFLPIAGEAARGTECPEVPLCAPRIAWPPSGSEIPVNPQIVVEGCPEPDLAAARPVLMSAQDQVPLRLATRLADGSYAFRPALPLNPATRYALVLREPPPEVSYEVPVWTTRDEIDTTPPLWKGAPRVSNEQSTAGLDGSLSLSLQLPIDRRDEPLAVLVQVSREPRGMAAVETPRLLPVDHTPAGGRALLRGGPCTSWPELSEPGDYSVRLVLFDPAGNRSPAETLRLRVPPPPEGRTGRAVTTLDGVDLVRAKVEPEYPESAREAGVTGTVSGRLLVDSEGAVLAVSVERGLPLGLDEATIRALYQWRLQPSEEPERRIRFETHFLLEPSTFDPDWNLE